MGTLGIAAAVLLGLVLLLLAVPVGVAFQVEGAGALTGHVAVRWLFGLVRLELPFPGKARRSERQGAEPAAARPEAGTGTRARRRRFLAVIRNAALRGRALRLLRDLFRAAHVQDLSLRLRIGLGDPADTGCLWALLGPLDALARGSRKADIRLEPEFVEPAIDLQAHGRAVLVPLHLLALIVAFLLSPASLRAWLDLAARRA